MYLDVVFLLYLCLSRYIFLNFYENKIVLCFEMYLCIIGVNEIIFMCYKYLYYNVYKK